MPTADIFTSHLKGEYEDLIPGVCTDLCRYAPMLYQNGRKVKKDLPSFSLERKNLGWLMDARNCLPWPSQG